MGHFGNHFVNNQIKQFYNEIADKNFEMVKIRNLVEIRL